MLYFLVASRWETLYCEDELLIGSDPAEMATLSGITRKLSDDAYIAHVMLFLPKRAIQEYLRYCSD